MVDCAFVTHKLHYLVSTNAKMLEKKMIKKWMFKYIIDYIILVVY